MAARIITGAELPPQGWSNMRAPARLDRRSFRPPKRAVSSVRTQPPSGGLYTSTLRYFRGELLGTEWTRNNPVNDDGRLLYRVTAKRKARIFVCNSRADYREAICRWPHHFDSRWYHSDAPTVDWPAMARDMDAFWLTDLGVLDTSSATNLHFWDTEQVLWLRPSFIVGRRLWQVDDPVRRRELEGEQIREEVLDRLRQAIKVDPEGMRAEVASMGERELELFRDLYDLNLRDDALLRSVGLLSLP